MGSKGNDEFPYLVKVESDEAIFVFDGFGSGNRKFMTFEGVFVVVVIVFIVFIGKRIARVHVMFNIVYMVVNI